MYIFFILVWDFVLSGFEFFSILFTPCFDYVYQITFYGFTDGACRHTLNLASATWVLYSQAHDLVNLGAACIGTTTNKNFEYHVVIGLLTKFSSWDIYHLVVFMDSQLVGSHLNHVYAIRNHVLLHLFRRVHLLERSFETITYQHVPRSCNTVSDSLANYMLDWYIAHS